MKRITSLLLLLPLGFALFAQSTDTTKTASVFERLTKELSAFKPDTTAPPADKTTELIVELRQLRGGFNVNEAVAFKLQEEKQKGEMPAASIKRLTEFFTAGNGKRWLDNAVIHIYRNQFTYGELKALVKFYKTSAGQKMADVFPLIMLKSFAAGETIRQAFEKEAKAN